MKRIVIGTRASKLAMIQTQWVVERLQEQWPGLEIAIEQISTKGDHIRDKPLTQIGGDGVFVKEIEHALHQKRIDLAVHSLKDLPTAQPEGLCIVVVGPREDVRDVLVSNHPELSTHSRIGTCSLRRTAQIRALFPNAQILPLRGNVDTRLRKLDAGDYDGIVLAAAGLHRLALRERLVGRITYLPIEVMMPAPGQGALAVEMRDEPKIQALIAPIENTVIQATTSAERMFMRRLGAGCYLPVAAYGEVVNEMLTLQGIVISLDGQRQVRVQQSIRWTPPGQPQGPHTVSQTASPPHPTTLAPTILRHRSSEVLVGHDDFDLRFLVGHAEQLGIRLAEQALAQGAAEIIAALVEERDNSD